MKCFLDTETFSFAGPPVIIQTAFDDGPIEIHNFWSEPINKSIELLDKIIDSDVIAFNLAFDWFQISKIYTMFEYWGKESTDYPEDHLNDFGVIEEKARDGSCIKPKRCCDVMLVARKTVYQKTMDRKPVKLRKIPTSLAWQLAEELEKRLKLDPILFANRKDKTLPQWRVVDITLPDGKTDPNFKNLELKFRASTRLKALAEDALGVKTLIYSDIEIKNYADHFGWAPFATAHGKPGKWNNAWPDVAKSHINHWNYHGPAREYASNDILYLRQLYNYFGKPEPGDDDSELAAMVGSVRWRGFAIDIEGIKKLREEAINKRQKYPTAPKQSRAYIMQAMDETEKLVIRQSTKKVILEEVAGWKNQACPFGPCDACNNTGRYTHPAAELAQNVLDARGANKEIELYDKLLQAGRFHASFKVIGTLSSRMSGADGLNPQGIKKTKYVRSKFPLAPEGYVLCGGDFDGFEIVLADAAYGDPRLREDLKSGKKIHALFGIHVYPHMTYDEILKSSGTSDDKYTRCKSAVFAMLYGGEGYTLQTRLGVDRETADKAYELFVRQYPRVGAERRKVFDMFCSMRQTGGVGTRVEWEEPSEYIESLLGFRRYFTLENYICKTLFLLANNPPKSWRNIKVKVTRRDDRVQTASGAVQSALYGAAFGLQSGNMRAAANHVIQSSGATITKALQRAIWDLQPIGVNPWFVQPMNVHDEIMCSTKPEIVKKLTETVNKTVESFREKIPLIKMEWGEALTSWADK